MNSATIRREFPNAYCWHIPAARLCSSQALECPLDSGMPDFRDLVLQVYERLDPATHAIMTGIPRNAHNQWTVNLSSLNPRQAAEVRRFISNDYDVVLGLLERRLDEDVGPTTSVRERVSEILRDASIRPAPVHKALIKLADRGGATTLLTTNFDRLFELAARQAKLQVRSHSLGAIPRPGRALDFAGVSCTSMERCRPLGVQCRI